jgi:hypothetical protein
VTGKPIRPDEHDLHERLLVVRFVTDDELEPAEAARARALISSCPGCAALAGDVKAISRATVTSLTPSRPRDFRLTPEQAAAAHGSRLRRWLGGLTSPGMGSLRPLAGAAVALGLLLVVAGGGLPGFGGASPARDNSAGAPSQVETQEATTPTTADVQGPYAAATPAPAANPAPAATAAPAASGPPALPVTQGTAVPAAAATDVGTTALTPRPQPGNEKSPREPEGSGEAYAAATANASQPPKVGLAAGASPQPTAPPAAAQPTSAPVFAPAPAPASPDNQPAGIPLLVLVGLLLGIVGLAVLVLTWVARRATKDPLLR